MKVRCTSNNVNQTGNSKLIEWAKSSELEITEGKEYIVLAIAKYFDSFSYYICSDLSDNYPLAFPAELFEIVDSRVSKYWNSHIATIESLMNLEIENNSIISFPEWALSKDYFYEKVLEEDPTTMQIFNSYKDNILSEC